MKYLDRSRAFARVRMALVGSTFAFGAGLAPAAVLDADNHFYIPASATSTPTTVTLRTAALPTAISYSVVLAHYPNAELLTQIGFTATTSVSPAGGPAAVSSEHAGLHA